MYLFSADVMLSNASIYTSNNKKARRETSQFGDPLINQEYYFLRLGLFGTSVCVFPVRLVERKKAVVKRCEEQLLKLEVQATDREENKQIALGTSKLNYLDPRISVAW